MRLMLVTVLAVAARSVRSLPVPSELAPLPNELAAAVEATKTTAAFPP